MRLVGVFAVLCACSSGGPATSGKARDSTVSTNTAQDATPAASGPIAMTIAARDGWLDVTLTNTSSEIRTVATRVESHEIHLDWLTVELEDAAGAVRRFTFSGDRDESARIDTDLAPGKSVTESVDLAAWSPRNGGPLAPGAYTFRAVWDAARESTGVAFVATATGTVTIPAPGKEGCQLKAYRAPAGAKPQLLGRALPGTTSIEIGLHNAGSAPVCLYTHVWTHETMSDWLTVEVDQRRIELWGSRDKSAPVTAELPPGATVWQTWDLDHWAQMDRIGTRLPSGQTWVTAHYDSTRETDAWSGTMEVFFRMDVP